MSIHEDSEEPSMFQALKYTSKEDFSYSMKKDDNAQNKEKTS